MNKRVPSVHTAPFKILPSPVGAYVVTGVPVESKDLIGDQRLI